MLRNDYLSILKLYTPPKSMTKEVHVSLPSNISNEERSMYEPYANYTFSAVKVKKMKNIFVTFSGFCMNAKGLIKECHHNCSWQIEYYQNEASTYYFNVIDHPENLITLEDDRVYLAIHHPWFNYYHWISESIFRLWMVRRQLDGLVLILPEYYKEADFIMGSLEPFGIKNMFYMPNGKSLLVKNLCLPQIKPVFDSYNADHVKQVRSFYRNYVLLEKKIKVDNIDKLYISREFATRRKVTNEEEILKIARKYGFIIFHPENHTFLEQVATFSRVKYLVGTHGSGLTNLLFMEKGTSVLELHKSRTNELDHPSPLFWYLADALGVHYYHQLCDTDGKEDYFEGDYIIDAVIFEKNLVRMLN
jgi:capsular polysaccharide biosynthesis protein